MYDEWQLQNILQMECIIHQSWPINIGNCSQQEMVEINKFKDRMAQLLRQTYNAAPKDRSVWAISCNVHCYADYGAVETSALARNFTVPQNTVYSLGYTSHRYFFDNTSGLYIDEAYWPDNQPCAHTTFSLKNR